MKRFAGGCVSFTAVVGFAVLLAAGAGGQDWTATWAATTNLAPLRDRAAATFMPSTCEALQYGGVGAEGVPTDSTFIYAPAGDSWTLLNKTAKNNVIPGRRSIARLTWDPSHGVAVLFGGFSSYAINSAFVFDPSMRRWSAAGPGKCTDSTCPAGRYAHAQAWSGDLQQTLVFGGKDNPSIYYGDLWALSAVPARKGGLTWVWSRLDPQPDPDHGMPAARAYHRMAEIPSGPDQGKLLIYGGTNLAAGGTGGSLSDTWLYDPLNNTFEYVDALPPTATQHFAMGYVPSLNAVVINGGWAPSGYVNETWAFDDVARAWVRVATGGSEPAQRILHDLVSDPTGGCDHRAFVFSTPAASPRVADYTWYLKRP